MQAVILAAGKGTRMLPLTETRPKPLLKVANLSILEYNLSQLQDIVDEVILVVGYNSKQIVNLIGDSYGNLRIKYCFQKNQLGTGDAIKSAYNLLDKNFIVLYGDDLYFKKDIKKVSEMQYSLLVKEYHFPKNFGVVEARNNILVNLEEKPENPKSNLVNTGCYSLDKKLLNLEIKKSDRNEFELTDYIKENIELGFKVVKADNWVPVSYPWNLLDANKFLISEIKENEIYGKIEENVFIGERVKIGRDSVIKCGSYIEGDVVIGENCVIGPNCYIRGSTSIGDSCHIGANTEIKNSIIFENSNIPHHNYVGDSVIGSNCNLGAGTITANLRHDNKNIFVEVKGKLADTGRRKFGAIIGDNVKTGIGTLIYPGRKIGANKTTKPGEIVYKSI